MRTKRTLTIATGLVTLATLAIGFSHVKTSSAQKVYPEGTLAQATTAREDDAPFRFNGVTWRDKREFVERARCSTRVPTLDEQEEIERSFERFRASRGQERDSASPAGPAGPINVHFHVIRGNGGTEGNVTNHTVQDQIAVLNAAYSSTSFQFQLASVDRRNNDNWFNSSPGSLAEARMKRALRQGTAEDLNVYTLNAASGLTGWSTFPWDNAGHPRLDGVVLLYSTLPGGTAAPYNEGDIAVHEIGHWLGLYHTFQGGCHNPGDSVSDTPQESYSNFGCPVGNDTCNSAGLDPIENYMDYTDDACMFEFTVGQSARMDTQWNQYRAGQ